MFGREIIAELAEIDENLIRSPLTAHRSPLTPSQEALRDLPTQGDLSRVAPDESLGDDLAAVTGTSLGVALTIISRGA